MHTIEEGEEFGRGDTLFGARASSNKSMPDSAATSVTQLDA